MATGRRLLHTDPLRQLRVWYHNGEETWEELLRRLGAVCQHYEIPTSELQNHFCMTNPQTFPLRVADGYDRFQPDKALLVHMRAEIERNGFEVAILDPLITLHGLQESNPVLMRGVMDIFRDLAAGMDCSIEVVGHTRKPQAGMEPALCEPDEKRGWTPPLQGQQVASTSQWQCFADIAYARSSSEYASQNLCACEGADRRP
jgi:RecA-family ATPase